MINTWQTHGIHMAAKNSVQYAGNFLRKQAVKRRKGVPIPSTVESAFEDTKGYELTELGQQFVHYAMSDIPPRIEFNSNIEATGDAETAESVGQWQEGALLTS
jgi:hypothetical protein